MRTFIENYLHFMKNCIRPPYEKLKSLKSGFIENSNFENNRDPWRVHWQKIAQQGWIIAQTCPRLLRVFPTMAKPFHPARPRALWSICSKPVSLSFSSRVSADRFKIHKQDLIPSKQDLISSKQDFMALDIVHFCVLSFSGYIQDLQ